jgi:hypothetical protein
MWTDPKKFRKRIGQDLVLLSQSTIRETDPLDPMQKTGQDLVQLSQFIHQADQIYQSKIMIWNDSNLTRKKKTKAIILSKKVYHLWKVKHKTMKKENKQTKVEKIWNKRIKLNPLMICLRVLQLEISPVNLELVWLRNKILSPPYSKIYSIFSVVAQTYKQLQ